MMHLPYAVFYLLICVSLGKHYSSCPPFERGRSWGLSAAIRWKGFCYFPGTQIDTSSPEGSDLSQNRDCS